VRMGASRDRACCRKRLDPRQVQKKQEAKWLCSACGEDRNCNCNAPAVEKLAAKLEQDRQRARRAYEKKKAEQNQQPSHVREPAQTVFASAEEALAHAKNIVDGHPNNVPVRELAKIAGVDPKMIMEVRRRRGEESFTDRIRELPNYCKNIGHLRNQAHAPRLEEALGLSPKLKMHSSSCGRRLSSA
jgi:hypothetical protein